jgi:signal transduction histidine kinase
VRVRVADTGIGLGPTGNVRRSVDSTDRPASGGTGLANLRERLALAFGGDATLTLADHPPRGTLATLDLPAVPASGP